MRIVLDTAVFVQATLSANGPARECLRLILRHEHSLILSKEMLHELAQVLRYPRLAARHRLPEDGIYKLIGSLKELAEIVPLNPLLSTPIRDANDIIVMQTAMLGEAEVICTNDRDFFEPPAAEFLSRLGITVLDEKALLKLLRAESGRRS